MVDRVLVLRHHVEDDPGLVGEAFLARSHEVELVMMSDEEPDPSLEGYASLVVLGSTSSVYDPEVQSRWFGRELALLRDADERGIAILGICFGAQALCYAFGGDVRRAPESEVGWTEIDVEGGVALSSGPWFELHFDHCVLPPAATLLASSPRAVQAFGLGRHLGVQFHPEVDEVQLKEWFTHESSPRLARYDVAAILEQAARETPAARRRALELVDLFLARTH